MHIGLEVAAQGVDADLLAHQIARLGDRTVRADVEAGKGLRVRSVVVDHRGDRCTRGGELCRIILIDGERLAHLMIQYEIGVQTVHKYHAVRLDLDFFDGV